MLQFLVLSVIEQEDSYGYQISQRLKPVSNAKDSTLYPILKRMQDDGLVQVYDRQIQGRNRRYYRITSQGMELDKKKLVLPEPIKTFGTHEVPVKLHKDVTAKLAVKVTEA